LLTSNLQRATYNIVNERNVQPSISSRTAPHLSKIRDLLTVRLQLAGDTLSLFVAAIRSSEAVNPFDVDELVELYPPLFGGR
jgi:hypothetical protein